MKNEKEIPLKWDSDLINKFWDFYSHFPEEYFTNKYGMNIVRQFENEIKEGSKVLDYGCGTGFLIKYLLEKNFEIFGADSSPDSVNYVNNIYNGNKHFKGAYLIKDVLKLNLKFDIIFVIEVIEHLPDIYLEELFKNVYSLLSPDGKVIITTPNNENLELSKVYCPNCDHTFHRWQHVRSWDDKKLSNYLENSGFTVEKIFGTDFTQAKASAIRKVYRKIRYPFNENRNPHLAGIGKLKMKAN
jgi:2-polyprenyl-3-methyl-5-hydroxy-6-metoxy-1,4-benzoquinol methylase